MATGLGRCQRQVQQHHTQDTAGTAGWLPAMARGALLVVLMCNSNPLHPTMRHTARVLLASKHQQLLVAAVDLVAAVEQQRQQARQIFLMCMVR
jgi:hypothetical protein